ncbi:hypothetical protein HDU96_010419 [Phlyctochytrium bullatum]|nr:hypothetical protein HDU96_010419 [Phlyctochytrium bullatum]
MQPPPPNPAIPVLLDELRARLSPGCKIMTDAATLERRSRDVSYHTPCLPHAVVQVVSEKDVVAVMEGCHRHRIPVIPRAGGSSLEGHIIPTPAGGIVLDVSPMDKIVAVHAEDLDVVVQPGVGWVDLRDHLEPHQLFFPPDPGAAACVGGMCGTNCSGTLAFRYGTMKDNVLSLRVVLADGSVVKTRNRAVKSSAGYDLTRLFVGSEGTLGVVTEATLRLRVRPKHTTVALAQFAHLATAATAVQLLVRSGSPFHRLELLDDVTVKAVNVGIKDPAERFRELTTILAECAGATEEAVRAQQDTFFEICGRLVRGEEVGSGGVRGMLAAAVTPQEAERLWDLRKKVFFACPNARLGDDNGGRDWEVLVTDVAVPLSRLVESLAEARALLGELGLVGPIVAHAGDGNYHVCLILRKGDAGEIERAERFRDVIAKKAIEAGGTCTGEHGVGEGKRHLLEIEAGPTGIALMRKIKDTLDPHHILNPGKVLIPWKKIDTIGSGINAVVEDKKKSVTEPEASKKVSKL